MRIVICDDDTDAIQFLEQCILGYFKRKKLDVPNIAKFTSAETMLQVDCTYDLAFLDVEMPGLSGIGAIRSLRNRNKDLLVFIVTSHETSYLDEAMEEGIYRYMMKPLNPIQLQVNLNSAMRRIGSLNKKIPVETDHGVISFDTDEIITVYTERRKTLVRTPDEIYVTNQTYAFWEEVLPEISFAESHKGILVNLRYVRRIVDNAVEFIYKGEPAYLSVRNRATFKKKFMQYMNSIN